MLYYEAVAMDAYGHVTEEYRTAAARVLTERSYDAATGRLKGIVTAGGGMQDLSYDYDLVGNMSERRDRADGRDLYEAFSYDGLQRLTGSLATTGLASAPSLTLGYDAAGNIQHKYLAGAGVASYGYGALASSCSAVAGAVTPGPHAVSTVGAAQQFCYDAAGNVIRASGPQGVRTFAYTPYGLPHTLTLGSGQSGRKVGYEYGPNREKLRRLDYASANSPSADRVTHFIGNAEVRLSGYELQEVRRHLGPVMIVQALEYGRYRIERRYFLTDAQGSTAAVLSDWGMPMNASAAMSFDPFGARPEVASGELVPWSGALEADLEAASRRGYTGHEQVDTLGVIHMNGRIYDPLLGRFLQVDPYVQDPLDSQSLNRYSYVLNNPLLYTDPTGYWGRKEQGYLRTAAAIVISIWTGGTAAGLAASGAWGQAMVVAFVGGASAGALQSGTGRGALTSGLTAMVFVGINGYYGGIARASESGLTTAQYAQRALVSGVAGGVLASVQGQRFGSGFASAGFGSALAPASGHTGGNVIAEGFVAAIVGGTVSEVAGGKFGNGAVTAAFAHAVGAVVKSRAEMTDPADLLESENWGFNKNSAWMRRGRISVSTSEGVTSLRIGLTVARGDGISGAMLMELIDDIKTSWNGDYRFGAVQYNVNVSLIPVSGRADLTINSSDTGYSWALKGGDIMAINIAAYNNQTGPHEFGHNLGFGHNYNFTHQIMSYCFGCRAVQSEEVSRLVREYR